MKKSHIITIFIFVFVITFALISYSKDTKPLEEVAESYMFEAGVAEFSWETPPKEDIRYLDDNGDNWKCNDWEKITE